MDKDPIGEVLELIKNQAPNDGVVITIRVDEQIVQILNQYPELGRFRRERAQRLIQLAHEVIQQRRRGQPSVISQAAAR